MKKFSFLLFIFILSNAFAAPSSLEWQRVSLEEKLESKIKFPLSSVLDNGQYMVEAEVKVNDPGPPNFDDLQKPGVKVSDIKFDESKGDYIAFSKVGLEVPVIEKYNNEHQQKLKELHRFNESYDLFKNIESVTVTVWLSDMIPDELVGNVKNIVNNIKLPTGGTKPKIEFKKLKMEAANRKVAASQSMGLKDWLNWISKFGTALGMILTVLLLGIVGSILLKKWYEFMSQLQQEAQPEPETSESSESEDEEDEELSDEEATALELEDGFLESTPEENFARFRVFFENSKPETILMLKRWISESTELQTLALKAVAQQLEDEELIEIFKGLNDAERQIWKEGLDEFLESEDIKVANKFISEEVMRDMIGPSQIQDIELVDLLLTIRPDAACRFVKEKPEESQILMNLLTPQFSGKILDQLPEEEALEIIQNSLEFDFEDIKDDFAAFKKSLSEFRDGMKRKPFNSKILQMLPDFNPLKEKMLYNFLAREGMREEMVKAAKQFLPSDLIVKLPKDFMKTMMQNYPMAKKVQLLASLEADLKNTLMSSFSEEGSASREMLDLEFENLENDQMTMARIKNKADDIWKEFVHYAREAARTDEEFTSEIEMLIGSWVESMVEEAGGNDLDMAA